MAIDEFRRQLEVNLVGHAAVTQALPFILDHIASQTGATIQGKAGAVVSAIGDGLGLRTGSPAHFDGTKLQAWAGDPAGSLVRPLLRVGLRWPLPHSAWPRRS